MTDVAPRDHETWDDLAAEYAPRNLMTYMVGVYVAVNAFRDVYLLVDGPDCVYLKAQTIQGNHDYRSELLNVAGHHKVSHSSLRAFETGLPREDEIVALLADIATSAEVGCLLLSSLPTATILGIDYGRLCRQVARETDRTVAHLPGKSLSSDWLGGWAETLNVLVRSLPLGPVEPQPDPVAVVGHLFDRNEEDARGDVRELMRLLRALGLEPVAVWPAGGAVADFDRVRTASTVVSLPYARKAARSLARRLGAKLIEAELPFGLQATERFVRHIAATLGREAEAEALIEGELAGIVPKLEWLVPFLFMNRSLAWVGDPLMLPGFVEIAGLLGSRVRFAFVTNYERHVDDALRALPVGELHIAARHPAFSAVRDRILLADEVDCVVTNSSGLDAMITKKNAVLEFGFPSNHRHALYDRPRLGFRGFTAFVDDLANQMRLFRTLRMHLHAERAPEPPKEP